jgi:hypothetical protein
MTEPTPEDIRTVFSKSWLTSGRAGAMVIRENIDVDDVRREITKFVQSPLGRLLECAFDDFNDFIDSQFMHLKPNTPGWSRHVAQLQAERRYKEWFFALLSELRSFEQQHEAEVADLSELYL